MADATHRESARGHGSSMASRLLRDWRLYAAVALLAFWIWRIAAFQHPIGLVLFATSAVLPAATLLLVAATTRARADSQA